MAEIRIERKPAQPWSWLIVALLLILLVWALSALLGPQSSTPQFRDGASPVGALERRPPTPAAEEPALPRERPEPDIRSDPESAAEEAVRLRSRVMA